MDKYKNDACNKKQTNERGKKNKEQRKESARDRIRFSFALPRIKLNMETVVPFGLPLSPPAPSILAYYLSARLCSLSDWVFSLRLLCPDVSECYLSLPGLG